MYSIPITGRLCADILKALNKAFEGDKIYVVQDIIYTYFLLRSKQYICIYLFISLNITVSNDINKYIIPLSAPKIMLKIYCTQLRIVLKL
jgi:hypothetical protein